VTFVRTRPIGIVHVAFGPEPLPDAARRAKALGFAHIDVPASWEGGLELAVGDRMAFPSPQPHCSVPAPPDEPGMWERAVAAYRRVDGVRVEPWGGSIVSSVEAVRALAAEVPGLRFLIDTGHVAGWGEDPVDLLDLADHVQLRQARAGHAQVALGDGDGDVDFRRVLARLDDLGYDRLVSVEYFDLPDRGWPLADPVGCAVELADHVRSFMR
jgi:sugar phosphate isomerase/epimerase